jgi:hypothetical protein
MLKSPWPSWRVIQTLSVMRSWAAGVFQSAQSSFVNVWSGSVQTLGSPAITSPQSARTDPATMEPRPGPFMCTSRPGGGAPVPSAPRGPGVLRRAAGRPGREDLPRSVPRGAATTESSALPPTVARAGPGPA